MYFEVPILKLPLRLNHHEPNSKFIHLHSPMQICMYEHVSALRFPAALPCNSTPLRPFVPLNRPENQDGDVGSCFLKSTQSTSCRVEYNRQIGALLQDELVRLNPLKDEEQSNCSICEKESSDCLDDFAGSLCEFEWFQVDLLIKRTCWTAYQNTIELESEADDAFVCELQNVI